jgi:hypothetical protein
MLSDVKSVLTVTHFSALLYFRFSGIGSAKDTTIEWKWKVFYRARSRHTSSDRGRDSFTGADGV